MRTKFVSLLFIIAFLSACTGNLPTATQDIPVISTETPMPLRSATPPPFPTFTPTSTLIYQSPEPAGFPQAALLNDALPKANLLLARHLYADTVGHLKDEICYDVGIYNDDTYLVISCLADFTYPAPTGTLDANQSRFLQRWIEKFQGFEEPSMNGLLLFAGTGSTISEFSDQASMQAMLGEIEWTAHQYVHRGGTPSAVSVARSVLSNQLNKWLDDSTVLNFEATDFPDSCLDAPKPDEVCEQVVTQGFRIYFVVQGLMYEYHTDVWGYDIRPFGEPQVAPTQGAGG